MHIILLTGRLYYKLIALKPETHKYKLKIVQKHKNYSFDLSFS